MEGAVRIRVLFEGHRLLSKSQKAEGLKRCWLLLTPNLTTIAHLSHHLIHTFNLQNTCPHRLLLSMDGFVLPSFESSAILKDKDIIRVSRTLETSTKEIGMGCDKDLVKGSEIMQKLPVSAVKLPAMEEFEKETRGYQSESEDPPEDTMRPKKSSSKDGTSLKKRKRADKLQNSKKKKRRSSTLVQNKIDCSQENEGLLRNNFLKNGSDSLCEHRPKINVLKGVTRDSSNLAEATPIDSDKSSGVKVNKRKTKQQLSPVEDGEIQPCDSVVCKSSERLDQSEGSPKYVNTLSSVPGTKKLPSRSARRKKAKRQWLRELAKNNSKVELQSHSPEKAIQIEFSKPKESGQVEDEDEDEIVPVVVKPGHVRFKPAGKVTADPEDRQVQETMGVLQWNGITSKKKGQKWGKENGQAHKEKVWDNLNDWQDSGEREMNVEGEPTQELVDFEKLEPITRFPQEGDVIAYRLVELSSSWCPELSPFRVGKFSCVPSSGKVKLLPLLEHPIVLGENKTEEDDGFPSYSSSNYNEDGSLEIEFTSLVDVRLLNHQRSDQLQKPKDQILSGATDKDAVNNKAAVSVTNSGHRVEDFPSPVHVIPFTENGEQTKVWDEITQALKEKKAQLLHRENGVPKETTQRNAWSYKALRSSALGPTISFLRAQNHLTC
ncbi:hypothetical protein AMTRI_Chr06g176270 [Amborella trichopoda]